MTLSPTARSTLRRHRERGRYERAELYAVLDSALVCHLGMVLGDAPVVLPTGYGRDGDTLYLHGSTGAASLLAAFHHSLNYASAVIHGAARKVTDPAELLHGLRALVEHLAPGSWEHSRQPTRRELAATTVLSLSLSEASVKVRTGLPIDDDADVTAAQAWAGVLPLAAQWGTPIPCPLLPRNTPVPSHIAHRAPISDG
jgi:uncharacterized protein